jgi:CheY-like chemotaxis protein
MKRILVVDDEENIRMLYQEELQEEGYDVTVASNGIEALEILDKTPFDLVTLDIRMPGMDGINTVRAIKEKYQAMIVILVTAYGEYKQDFGTWAADAYLVKSADLSELKTAIKRLIG